MSKVGAAVWSVTDINIVLIISGVRNVSFSENLAYILNE